MKYEILIKTIHVLCTNTIIYYKLKWDDRVSSLIKFTHGFLFNVSIYIYKDLSKFTNYSMHLVRNSLQLF